MSQPDLDGPIEAWGLIFHGSGLYRVAHSRQEWACIADAIATADRRLNETVGTVIGPPPFVRGDATWCAFAVDTYRMLTAAGAYWHLRPGEEPFCAADEHVIRAYFGAPSVPPTTPAQTMLDASGWDTSFDPAYPVDPTSPVILANLAQDLGLLGGAGHRVGLWRATDDHGEFTDGFLVTVRPNDGPGWACPPLPPQGSGPDWCGAGGRDRRCADPRGGGRQRVARHPPHGHHRARGGAAAAGRPAAHAAADPCGRLPGRRPRPSLPTLDRLHTVHIG